MANKAVLACVHDTLQQVTQCPLPFGGKIVILLGDFRQTCPIVRRGTKADVIDASNKSSTLWHLFCIWQLQTPIRHAHDPEFSTFINNIRNGAGPTVCLNQLQSVNDMSQLMDFVFPYNVLCHPASCTTRAILAPTNQQVDCYNSAILHFH
jgi:PIF1-like helicase